MRTGGRRRPHSPLAQRSKTVPWALRGRFWQSAYDGWCGRPRGETTEMAGETPTRQPGHTGAKRLHAVSKLQKSRPPHLEDGFWMERGVCGWRLLCPSASRSGSGTPCPGQRASLQGVEAWSGSTWMATMVPSPKRARSRRSMSRVSSWACSTSIRPSTRMCTSMEMHEPMRRVRRLWGSRTAGRG